MKKIFSILMTLVLGTFVFAQRVPDGSRFMVVGQKSASLSANEAAWLTDSVRSKLEENLQSYTTFSFVASDLESIKKIQRQSESELFDEKDAIEIGKLKFAKYAVFVTIRKSGSYTVVADVTDLTTGAKLATASSKERNKADDLFSRNGCAADEVTVKLCEKLGIKLGETQRKVLLYGDENSSIDEQAKMAKEEESAFNNAIAKYYAEIKRLSTLTDLESIAAKKQKEADRAMIEAKMKASSEKAKRLAEEANKAAADKKADAERSEEQRRKRDEMARLAAAKAEEVRKTSIDNGSVYTKIDVIESKKKAVVDIQHSYDIRVEEIKAEGEEEYSKKKSEIMNAPYRSAEKNADGTPSATAKERRNTLVQELLESMSYEYGKQIVETKYYALDTVKSLLKEIKIDQMSLTDVKTVSSLENDLKVQYALFDGKTNSWKTTFWLYSKGLLVCSRSFDMTYKDLTGKNVDVSNTGAYNEFMDTVDLYNSLFSRGDHVVTIKIDYRTESVDDYSSSYKFIVEKVHVIDTVSGREISSFGLKQPVTTYQNNKVYSLNCELAKFCNGEVEKEIAKEKAERIAAEKKKAEEEKKAKENLAAVIAEIKSMFVTIKTEYAAKGEAAVFDALKTEVTQKLYKYVMGENPSYHKGDDLPVESVSLYDAVYFCNKLSLILGYSPVYSVKGKKDPKDWGYQPHKGQVIENLEQDFSCNGCRLPTTREFQCMLNKPDEEYKFAGSNKLDEVAWYVDNYDRKLHPVAQKKPNSYGLFDLYGNVSEFAYETGTNYSAPCYKEMGGSYLDKKNRAYDFKYGMKISYADRTKGSTTLGFRVVRTVRLQK
ncbi:MAG: SUMF1/EgtB/PvdO family nonheme iron enzyme [Treponema sp.]|nr:SUMF1/EgtB/PvdO family nonheme iron enzyme [Treponema sp.]